MLVYCKQAKGCLNLKENVGLVLPNNLILSDYRGHLKHCLFGRTKPTKQLSPSIY